MSTESAIEYTPLARLLRLSTQLAQTNEPAPMFALVADYLADVIAPDRVSIALVADNPDELQIVGIERPGGPLQPGLRVPRTGSTLGGCLERDETTVWELADCECIDAAELCRRGLAVLANAPLSTADRQYGTLNAGFCGAGPSDADLEIITQLALLLASQLERVDLLASLEREAARRHAQAERLFRLSEIEAELSLAMSFEDVIDSLGRGIRDLGPVVRASYAQASPGSVEMSIHPICGMGDEPSSVPFDRAAFTRRYNEASVHYSADHLGSDHPVQTKLAEAGVLSSLSIGVSIADTPIGALNVGLAEPHALTEEDQALFSALGAFLGSTLERIEAHERMTHQAHHDQLTGLIRRDIFEQELEIEIERLRRSADTIGVCFVDLDRFKLVNDTAGHQAGDLVLRETTARLERCLGPDDVLSRVGGDEFVVMMRGRRRDDYLRVCGAIVNSISQHHFIAGKRVIHSSVSIGLCLVDSSVTSRDDIIAAADAACYVAKAHGGDRVSIASQVDDEQRERRTAASWLMRIEEAIDRKKLVLYGQPIRPLGKSGTEAIEVLTRMIEDDGRVVGPSHFVPVAERYGLITQLDAYVVSTTMGMVARAMQHGDAAPPVFVNLSSTSISSDGFAERICEIIVTSGVPAEKICFEITETGTMGNFEAALDFIQQLRSIGARFALDDFGVGLSSLGHLQLLPVDYLKIDGSLVADIEINELNATMVAAIKSMADALDIATIAEHIESTEALDTVRSIGVSGAQGYFLGHPVPLERALHIAPSEPERPAVEGRAHDGVNEATR